jgi:hypothetical protein
VRTLRSGRINRNEKLLLSCAETVEDGTSLWKGKENPERIFSMLVWGGHCCPPLLNLRLNLRFTSERNCAGSFRHASQKQRTSFALSAVEGSVPPHAKNKSTAKAVLLKCLPFLNDAILRGEEV